jgi:hypothetical protein
MSCLGKAYSKFQIQIPTPGMQNPDPDVKSRLLIYKIVQAGACLTGGFVDRIDEMPWAYVNGRDLA